jgi:AcrR family transcriptional regulator
MPKIVDHDDRRRQIAELAIRVVCRDGREGATVRRIAREGGVSPGSLRHYFTNQDELIAFAFQWMADETFRELDRRTANAPAGLARLRVALEYMLPDPRVMGFMPVWLGLWSSALGNEQLLDIHRRYYGRWRGTIRRHLSDATRTGELTLVVTLADAVDILAAAVDGLWIGGTFEPRRAGTRRRRHLVERLLALLTHPQ